MLFAFDENECRVHIDDTQSSKKYYCPYCGVPMILKKGDVRQHHFAHSSNHKCSDSWEREHNYDISPWHNEWQSCFPKENQEVKLSLGETAHRADVLTGRTVVEFQHSLLSEKAFNDRNNFYHNLNYKLVWLFDLTELAESGRLTWQKKNHGESLGFTWKNPKQAFRSYDVDAGWVDLFFQISDDDTNCIVRVTNVSFSGFEQFDTDLPISKKEFLEYVGLIDGVCDPADRTDLSADESYKQFKEKYGIRLNEQQERAVQSIEGNVLLLAVPGSGKTTVLVDRLGYMVCEKHIDPGSILAITFTRDAAAEMRKRFHALFGKEANGQVDFRTINSLAQQIYVRYCQEKGQKAEEIIPDAEQKSLLRNIHKECYEEEYLPTDELITLKSDIGCVKNMMLTKEEIAKIDDEYPHFSEILQKYSEALKSRHQMDYDDQLVRAYRILKNDESQAEKWRGKYQYICVDEAQDTSKLQHAIIRILSQGKSLFMVGDEDQSIYGFRAAYPGALLNFRLDYKNAYILRMERNYRSTPQIVDIAQRFITENKGRYEKNMVAARPDGKPVKLIPAESREEQYEKALEMAKSAKKEIAFLYRDNDSSAVLIDYLLRAGIPFRFKKPEANFFDSSVVRDISAYLTLVIDEKNADALNRVCNKGTLLYITKTQKYWAVRNCREKGLTVYDALDEQIKFAPNLCEGVSHFKSTMSNLAGKNTADAIHSLMEAGYEAYLEENNNQGFSKIEILLILAKQEPDIENFLRRLDKLKELIKNGHDGGGQITLSTVHSAKGLEYDTVCMIDVYNGRFPSAWENPIYRSKDSEDGGMEERRVFYVGMTRAKNELILFDIRDKPSSYIEELFPEVRLRRENERARREPAEQQRRERALSEKMLAANKEKEDRQREAEEARRKGAEERRKQAAEAEKRRKEAEYRQGYNEVKDRFTQPSSEQILDSKKLRWVKCEKCGKILPEGNFVSYGGIDRLKQGRINFGVCEECGKIQNPNYPSDSRPSE